jgi:Cu(I)/Ag(I) efflux system membrane protein CusA/SilA
VALFGGDLAHLRVDRALADAFPGLGSSFLPPLDEGALLFMPSVPATAGLGETQRVLGIQNRRIAEVGEVALVMGKMGRAETALDPAPLGMIETIVLLKPYRDWPVVEMPDGRHRHRTLAEVRTDLAATTDLPGVAPSWLQPIETRVVMLSTGIRAKLALQLAGQDLAALDAFATQVEPLLAAVPGAADVQMQREGGKPYGELRLDLEQLNRFGLTPEAVLSAIESGLGGMPLSMAVVGNQRYGIRLRIDREQRDDTDEIDLFPIPVGAGGHGAIPLAHLLARPTTYTLAGASTWLDTQPLAVRRAATPLGGDVWELTLPAGEEPAPGVTITARRPAASALTWTIGPMAIRSESGQRLQYVLLNTRGRGEVDVVRDADARLRAALARGDLHLPPGVTWRWVGNYEQKLKADATMRWVIGGSLAIMLVLIWLGTRSLLVTGIIVTCNLTVSCAGGFLAVWFAGAEMTTAVAVGFLVLLGVMFNDGILLGTYLHQAFATSPRDVNDRHARVFAAGLRRRRPALMTNCTTLLALIPILWAEGRGAEVMRPMVLPVIGGMIADLLSLFSVPVLYTWWWEQRLRKT